tara:strand:- start:573 stop:1448 length:876 start_codon:yes stop_codon:yes gene_type:complete
MNVEMNSITGVPSITNLFKTLPINPNIIIIVVVVIVGYIIFFGNLGSSKNSENLINSEGNKSNGGSNLLGIILAAIFIVLLVINGFNYLLNIDVVTSIKNIFTPNPEIDINVKTPNNMGSGQASSIPAPIEELAVEEVFHIPDNRYTYADSKALCAAYGGRLANIKDLQDTYAKGGQWCNYGWSEDQMILFPTQDKHWKKLQKIKGHENDCGRPGVNGGYIDNPNVKFGVNCYGHKPKRTPLEGEIMELTPNHPITRKEQKFQEEVEYWKEKLQDILVSPFNNKLWSKATD